MTDAQELLQLRAENTELTAQVAKLTTENSELATQVAALLERVQIVEARLSQDSHNSSKPPSSDGFTRSPKQRSLRKSSGKKPGGQAGHAGKALLQVEKPDYIVDHLPTACQHCHFSLTELARGPLIERRQVFDLPRLKVQVTEHRAYSRTCPNCTKATLGQFPLEATNWVQYGPAFRAVAVYLLNQHLIPYARTAEILNELFSYSLSPGTLAEFVAQCHTRLAEPAAAIKAALQQADVLHSDETGMYVCGKREWLHVASTATLTHYEYHHSRGKRATDAIGILPAFCGVLVHDGFKSYTQNACQHALCNAHHLRELTFVSEQLGQVWARELLSLLCNLKTEVDRACTNGLASLKTACLLEYETLYQKLIELGLEENPPPVGGWPKSKRGRVKQTKAKNLIDRLDKQRQQVLAFAYDFKVPFDNNQAERDLRMCKVQQKISGCFRSVEGATYFCRIRGYLSTLKKQGQNVFAALFNTFLGQPPFPTVA
jgi:transposase